MSENISFTERLISKLQGSDRGDQLFVSACSDYLVKRNRIVWDEERGLFWVLMPSGPPQVAVWLIDVAKEIIPDAELKQ